MTDLRGKRALVTGASRGIGASIEKRLAAAGAVVALVARNEAALKKVKVDIETAGGTAELYPADLSDRRVCRDVAARAGEIDILINNAAMTGGKFMSTLASDDDEWDINFAVSFMAPLIMMQEIGRGMAKRKRGVILNISSIAAQRPAPYLAPYGIFKSALDNLSRVVGIELAAEKTNIRVNSVSIGLTDTEALAEKCGKVTTPAELTQRDVPLGRPIKPEEVADFCLYLVSDSAAPILGTVLTIDGGLTAGSYSLGQAMATEQQS